MSETDVNMLWYDELHHGVIHLVLCNLILVFLPESQVPPRNMEPGLEYQE